MKTFELETGDRLLTVTVERAGHLLRVTADGRTCLVDARRVGDMAWSLLVAPGGNGGPASSLDATLAPGRDPGTFDVHLDGRVVPVRIRPSSAFARPRAAATAAGHGGGPERLVAPMPGKIVRLLVGKGDAVAPRQGLVVVEAMKMENELRASRAGRVQEVAVTEGQSVEAGALLVVVG